MEISLNIEGTKITVTIDGPGADEVPPEKLHDTLESRYQIKEGNEYAYCISQSGYTLSAPYAVVQSKIASISHTGRIIPNTYVGTLPIELVDTKSQKSVDKFELEVISVKADYRTHYRKMLDDIASKNVNLILQHSSPVVQKLSSSFDDNSKTDYQQFAFLKSILDSEDFSDSIERILYFPVTKWEEEEIEVDIHRLKRLDSRTARRFANAGNRVQAPASLGLPDNIGSIPQKISQRKKVDTVDTSENQFIKHALEHFAGFIEGVYYKAEAGSRLSNEALELVNKLSEILHHSFFREISPMHILPLNSPVLQRKEGYRNILRTYLMFDLAAKLQWKAGDEIYSAGKKNVAVLYEYWLFFQLLDIAEKLFELDIPSIEQLVTSTKDQLGINLLQGKPLKIHGLYTQGSRKLNVEFHYNKTFSYNPDPHAGGSWTKNMKPDYTFSFWPHGISLSDAEEKVLVTHIHFDAKYKVDSPDELFGSNDDDFNSDVEKQEQSKGNYKRDDLLKMHAYRDAIRRTGGAYVLYPGNNPENTFQGFHEIIPGLGAFAINPSSVNSSVAITAFLRKILETLENRVSQWDLSQYQQYEIHKDKPNQVFESALPELTYRRDFIPSKIHVLVGYVRNKAHMEWIQSVCRYNTRTGEKSGAITINSKEAGAEYLLLYDQNTIKDGVLLKITSDGPEYANTEKMKELGYPEPKDASEYLLFHFKKSDSIAIGTCDISKLRPKQNYRPFVITLEELYLKLRI